MGGGPENPTHMFIDDDDVSSRVSALVLKEEPNTDENMVMKTEDSDDDKEDVGSGVAEPDMSTHKVKLMRELKALGVNLVQKPDYTKPLDEPSWGDSDDDEELDEEMEENADGVLDGEDEDFDDEDESSDDNDDDGIRMG